MALLQVAAWLTIAWAGYSLLEVIYNVFFHPLAKFPGPWWAGASYLPELYFDVFKGGQYFKQVEKMHSRYGSMVRVTPEELSIVDPNFQDTRYGGIGVKRNKNERFARQSVSPTSILNTLDHDLHRVRRAPLNGFFSKQAISRFEPTVQSKVEKVVEKLKRACVQGAVLRAQDVYGALTTDVISHYAYGESFGFLDDGKEGFKNDYLRDTEAFFKMTHFAKHFHVAASVMLAIPEWVVVRLHKGMASMAEIVNFSKRCALDTLVSLDLDNKVKALDAKPMSIFQALCKSDVPAEERSLQRLTDEGIVVILAGLETTARFLTNITYHLLSNPAMLQELRAELKKVMLTPDARVTCAVLENLPYMSAIIYEGLRCEKIMMFRAPRVNCEPIQYNGWTIPAMTTLSASPYMMNNNESIFPDPQAFRPERWLEARARGENLHKHLGTFGKGSRMCLGMNLAISELYLMVAAVVRNFDLELVDAKKEDMAADRDFAMAFTKDYTWGVKIRVTKVLEE